MIRWIADQNFHGPILRGLARRCPAMDVVRTQELGFEQLPDPDLLAWAAENDRVVLTHDRGTMSDFAYQRIRDGKPMPGVVVVSDRIPVRIAIDELQMIEECCNAGDIDLKVWFVPIQ